MPSTSEFKNAKSTIGRYVELIGDEVEDEVMLIRSGELDPLEGYHCLHGENSYFVAGTSETEYFQVLFIHELRNQIAQSLAEDVARQILGIDGEDDSQTELKLDAAEKLLNNIDSNDMERLSYHLFQQISSPQTAAVIQENEDNIIEQFRIERKIFPYEDRFSLSDFNYSVQSVMAQGILGVNFIARTFDIGIEEKGTESEYEVEIDIEQQ